jgi:uncharacterized protein DUF4190
MESNVTESAPERTNETGTIENRAAVAGLIASNIGFVVLFVGGVVGIVFGIIALLRTRDPRFRGRGMAICAIVVGVLSIGTSAFFTYSLYEQSKVLPGP